MSLPLTLAAAVLGLTVWAVASSGAHIQFSEAHMAPPHAAMLVASHVTPTGN